MGLLATNVAYDYVKTKMELLHEADPVRLEADFAELEEQAAAQLARDGFAGDQALLERSADCRYVGQGYELRIPLPAGAGRRRLARAGARDLPRAARATLLPPLRRRSDPARQHPLVGVGGLPDLALAPATAGGEPRSGGGGDGRRRKSRSSSAASRRACRRRSTTGRCSRPGTRSPGPAIIHQFDSTTVVNPGLVARVDAVGNLLIDCSGVRDTGITSLAAGAASGRGAGSPSSTR